MPISENFSMEPAHELGVKARKHALRPLQHGHIRARARRNVRELRSNITSTDHDDLLGQILKLHECVAGDGV
jgi:hypothetical protein